MRRMPSFENCTIGSGLPSFKDGIRGSDRKFGQAGTRGAAESSKNEIRCSKKRRDQEPEPAIPIREIEWCPGQLPFTNNPGAYFADAKKEEFPDTWDFHDDDLRK